MPTQFSARSPISFPLAFFRFPLWTGAFLSIMTYLWELDFETVFGWGVFFLSPVIETKMRGFIQRRKGLNAEYFLVLLDYPHQALRSPWVAYHLSWHHYRYLKLFSALPPTIPRFTIQLCIFL